MLTPRTIAPEGRHKAVLISVYVPFAVTAVLAVIAPRLAQVLPRAAPPGPWHAPRS